MTTARLKAFGISLPMVIEVFSGLVISVSSRMTRVYVSFISLLVS